ncbi:MAG: class I SAM-dependent methyltransferase [Clostridia bacterium]|nr:class I SAM-dependent methyltransferase [Clostridia bacterium]
MQINNGYGWTFDGVAEDYNKFRPGYPEELYDAVFEYAGKDRFGNALEIGIGAGQATLPVLKRAERFVAVEPGVSFCDMCRDKFRDFSGFSVINSSFEESEMCENSFDLALSATAFHWVAEEAGYTKLFSALKAGGVFARFANRPYRDKGNLRLADEIDELYDRYYNRFYGYKKKVLREFDEDQAKSIADIAGKYGFADIEYRLFKRERVFSADEYVSLIGTYSDHIALREDVRKEFFAGIHDAIERHGGKITIYDMIDLELARKPK